ncbi:putative mediator of RNA polymerase II transcription subunit 26c [Acorus calamus]|uniref:Mediator of RNA polymerase II transcription subunit 26c n=1 Tax=Acorus calamus TaxID=4465 RepID=A0AAV9FDQ6_ACOCL|nr:putative mediator of RNA polymerase II transcription subunit 26c [Acorus calamus]
MDSDDLRSILTDGGLDLWDLIDAAVSVAATDHPNELRSRRDGIVEHLFAPTSLHVSDHRHRPNVSRVPWHRRDGGGESPVEEDEQEEQIRIVAIKDQIEDPDQSEEGLCDLLQSLADMEITFKALKETDIGRHVNRLRKHPSSEVRRLVKLLVRKWKESVDEWVKLNPTASNAIIAKKQRTIQVMDIHELPKKKNTFFARNKGSSVQTNNKHW